jgi:electron transport complex protein RnfG
VNESVQLRSQTSSLAMLRTLGGIAMISGFLVVLVFQWTRPIIAENKRIAIEKAVFQVVPNAVSRKDFVLGPEGISPFGRKAKGETVYAAYNSKGELQGIALEAAAPGYQDVIRILYGYSPKCECVTGIKVLKMTETPGLGDKIAYDPDFLRNFYGLDGTLNEAREGLAHAIVAVKHGSKTEPWQIDAISGATISSKAIGRMIDASGARMFPLIQRHLAGFRQEVVSAERPDES